ncbi:hypothetical protein AA0119_g1063 [Alternaria tenuissima]|uniref:REJ domain-containing protein n=1 Tax=Alternaria tenuissima TaxID=119927 RepID=A0ABY0GNK8_9PLEO|nr:hypothetical protein AA0119_g1063 [Alternaria tenuissima]RYO22305.1 hypothetical protein AA0121_g2658 [Alternaria tenuissima]
MGWFAGAVFAYCTASLVVGINVEFNWKNARLSNTHITNERFPTFPRRDLPFSNGTSTLETVQTTSRVSSSLSSTSKSESSTTSTVIVHEITSSQQPDTATRSSVADAGTSAGRSNNLPAKTSTRSDSSTVLPTTTVVPQPTALSSIFLISSGQTSTSSHTSPGSSGTASFIRTSSTVKELSIVSDARSTANNPISSTAWVNTDPSQVSDVQLPTSISSAIISLQSTPSTSLQLPVSVIKSQQSTLGSISSLTVSATTIKQSATRLSMPGTAFFTPSTTRQQDPLSDISTEVSNVVLPLTQTSWAFSRTVTADAIAITTIVADFSSFSQATATNISSLKSLSPMAEDSASPTSTLTLPTPSGSPTTIAGLPQHSVLSLTSWLRSSYPATIDGSSLAAITRLATPTKTSLYSTISGSSLGSVPTSEAKNETNTAIRTKSVQSSSFLIDSSTFAFGGSLTISASVTFEGSTLSRITIPTDNIVATVTGNTSSTASITTMSIRATGLGAHSATENRTVSSSVALSTTSLETSVLPSAGTNGSSPSTVETSSFSSPISASLTQIIISSTTSRTLSTASSIQSVGIPTAPLESDRNITVTSTTASTATTMMSLSSWSHPSLSASLVGSGNISLPSATHTYTSTGTAAVTESISTSHASRSGSSHMSPAFGKPYLSQLYIHIKKCDHFFDQYLYDKDKDSEFQSKLAHKLIVKRHSQGFNTDSKCSPYIYQQSYRDSGCSSCT